MKVATRRLLEEQLVDVAVLGSGKNSDAMWHVPHYARGDQGVLPMRVGGATSQLYLPSLTPLSVAGCG